MEIKDEDSLNIRKEICYRLINARLKFSKSKTYIAHLLNVSPQQISKYENGQDKISLEKLVIFCSRLNISLDEFLSNIHKPTKKIQEKQKEFNRMHIEINKQIINIENTAMLKTIKEIIKNISNAYLKYNK